MSARRFWACALLALVGTTLLGATRTAHAQDTEIGPASGVDRVLVLSLPTLSWEDIDFDVMPNLRRLYEQSLVADLSVRGVRRHPSLGDGYVTIGAGARAVSRTEDGGECFDADERFETGTARDALLRRTGVDADDVPPGALVCLAQSAIAQRNDRMLYDAQVGLLAETLEQADVRRAVIGNADQRDPPPFGLWQRDVGLSLADRDGVLPDGEVGSDLLVADANAPFGTRSNLPAYLEAFDRTWSEEGRAVVLVEASDLARFEEYRQNLSPTGRAALFERVLGWVDELVGELMARVEPGDAVMTVGTSQRDGPGRLTVTSLRAPGVTPGLARSAYTRKAGVVSIVDVTPTILDQLDIERPPEMEGRAYEFGRRGGDFESRVDWMTETNAAAQFRDRMIPHVTGWFVALQAVLTFAAVVAFVRLGRRALVMVELAALSLLGFLPATYVAGLLPFYKWGAAPYWLFLLGVGVLIGVFAWATTSRRGVTTLILALSIVAGVVAIDVVTGARLQFNTTLGYSPTIAGRFAGLGNLGYAQLAASAVLLAGFVAFQIGGRRGAWIGIAIMAAAIVVDGAPMFGSDVGGVLSMVPAYLLTGSLLLGWKFRWRLVGVYAVVTLVAISIVAAVDLSRPEDKRTHLGRLIDVGSGDGGWHRVSTVIERKISENGEVLFSSVWTIMLPLVLLGIGYLIYLAPGRMHGIYERIPQLAAALIGLATCAVLGFAFNDSGIAVPGVMLGVVTPVLVVVTIRGERVQPRGRRRADGDPVDGEIVDDELVALSEQERSRA
jgi:hypothetical protein